MTEIERMTETVEIAIRYGELMTEAVALCRGCIRHGDAEGAAAEAREAVYFCRRREERKREIARALQSREELRRALAGMLVGEEAA